MHLTPSHTLALQPMHHSAALNNGTAYLLRIQHASSKLEATNIVHNEHLSLPIVYTQRADQSSTVGYMAPYCKC